MIIPQFACALPSAQWTNSIAHWNKITAHWNKIIAHWNKIIAHWNKITVHWTIGSLANKGHELLSIRKQGQNPGRNPPFVPFRATKKSTQTPSSRKKPILQPTESKRDIKKVSKCQGVKVSFSFCVRPSNGVFRVCLFIYYKKL